MIVQKVLNNNLILASDESGREQIVMGKGLRFFCQVGQELPAEHVQKVYILREEGAARRYRQLLRDVPPETAEAIEEAMELAYQRFPDRLNDQIFVTLFSKFNDYEYALTDEENCRIIFVLCCNRDIKKLPLDKEFLPLTDELYADAEGWYGYSIYHFQLSDKGALVVPSPKDD